MTELAGIEQPTSAPPKPVLDGVFSLYELRNGGMALHWQPGPDYDDQEERRVMLPPALVTLANRAAAGEKLNPMAMLKAITGLGG